MSTRDIEGMAVEIDGAGDAVLCIHGLGGSSNTWTPVMKALDGFTVIRPDLPGSARSALALDKLSIDLYVAAIEHLLGALNISSMHVTAHSMGTVIAQHFAVQNLTAVKSLALFGPLTAPPAPARPNILARAQLARTGASGMQEIADAIVSSATSTETKAEQPAVLALVRESIMRQPYEGYAQSCEALAAAESAAIEQIKVPTVLVTGDQDVVAPPTSVAAMARRISGSRSTVLRGCGHWTMFEKPAQCSDALREFYSELR